MKKHCIFLLFSVVLAVGSSCKKSITQTYSFVASPTWEDDFTTDGLPNPAHWSYDVGGHGWGNQELQFYTDSRLKNARVENGKLIIEAHKESFNGSAYTSARLVTKQKADWLYGRVVVRAKLPRGRGTWPAAWLLASQQTYGGQFWPDNGELDVIEHVGFDPGRVHANIHTRAYHHSIGTNKGSNVVVPDVQDAFHDYSMDWTPESVTFKIDETVIFKYNNPQQTWKEWPFDKPFHLLLNIAVGGGWGGQQGIDDSIFPQKMEVEYVRYYKMK